MRCFASTSTLETLTLRRLVSSRGRFSSQSTLVNRIDGSSKRIVAAARLMRREIRFIAEARQLASRSEAPLVQASGATHDAECR